MSRPSQEHAYIGLSEVSSAEETSDIEKTKSFVKFSEETRKGLNFKATELRLGLPGSESPERVSVNVGDNDEFNGAKNLVSGAKRGFSDAIDGGSDKWVLHKNGGCDAASLKGSDDKKLQSSPVSEQGTSPLPSSKAQVVGWPPIRSFRKNSMATTNALKINENKDCKLVPGCQYIKVSMDGAPYLRKIDVETYGSYVGLSSALEKMFSGFTMGQHGKKGLHCQEQSKGKLIDTLQHSEYVLTYEDKDGDWMLVGDVPWNMFKDTCRRLRIMKSSEAVGLASITSDG